MITRITRIIFCTLLILLLYPVPKYKVDHKIHTCIQIVADGNEICN